MKAILPLLALTSLCACSSAIKYSLWDSSSPTQAGSLRFQLPDSSFTFAQAGTQTSAGAQAGKQACPTGTKDPDWWECLNNVAVQSLMAPNQDPKSQTYLAVPADGHNLNLTTTTISGVPITGQDALYSTVTVKYKNNAGAVITGATTSAVTGFGLGGPYGAAIGFVLGFATTTISEADANPNKPPPIEQFVCKKDLENVAFNASNLQGLQPSLFLPVTIAGSDVRDYPTQTDIDNAQQAQVESACWHLVKNTHQLGKLTVTPSNGPPSTPAPRLPEDGDGWLIRVVIDAKSKDVPAGTKKATEFLGSSEVQDGFPVPICRTVKVQITWWSELNRAIEAGAAPQSRPRMIEFASLAADPDYVTVAELRKGGTVSFRPSCGANVSMDLDASTAATVNALVNSTVDLYKAEQTWENSRKKK